MEATFFQVWQIILPMNNAQQKSNSSRKKHKSPLLLPALSSKQVTKITHFLRMGQLDFIVLKGPDNTFPT